MIVSVSLRSYIHSYQHYKRIKRLSEFGFRLLTEYHSFLFLEVLIMKMEKVMFPSPYGVIFILT